MKITQVIDVKPTLSEKEFLRMVLAKVASAEGAPFDVAEKIVFGEVKHTTDYALFENCRRDVEYSVIVGHNSRVRGSSIEFTQWQEKPYIGIYSFDDLRVSVLDREDRQSDLYEWGNQSDWAKGFIKSKDSDDEDADNDYQLSTETVHEEVEIPSSESDWILVSDDDFDYHMDLYSTVSSRVFLKLENIPGDEYKDLELLKERTQVINSTVYKLHNYEVSYTYEGQTYYAKARAIKESNEVLLASNGIYSTPKEEKSLDDIVSDKQKTPVLLANISWILTYASAAVSIILSVLGNSSLWYLPFIMIAASVVVTIICNRVSKEIGWSTYSKYSAYSRRNKIMPLLHRTAERVGIGEFTEEETTKAMEMFKDPERPKNKKVAIGDKMVKAIPLAIGAAIIAFCFGFAANL